MRLSLLLPCVVLGGTIGVSVFAQTKEEPPGDVDPFSDVDIESAEPTPLPGDIDVEVIEEPETAESVIQQAEDLRRQYLQLIEQKSSLMDRSALREAISRAEQDIDELKADETLQEARQLLLELVKTHPETNSARTARAMLQAGPDGSSNHFGFPPQVAPPVTDSFKLDSY